MARVTAFGAALLLLVSLVPAYPAESAPAPAPTWQELFDAGDEAYRTGLAEKAAALFAKALGVASDPEQKFETLMALAQVRRAAQQWDLALKAADNAIEFAQKVLPLEYERHAEAIKLKGFILYESGRVGEARAHMNAARALITNKFPDIWNDTDPSVAVHRLTNLHCPDTLGVFFLAKFEAFKASGEDVGCTYTPRGGGGIMSVFFSKRATGETFEQDFKGARAVLEDVNAGASLKSTASWMSDGLLVKEAIYATADKQGRPLHSGLWMYDIKGWTLAVRTTFPANVDAEGLRNFVKQFILRASQDVVIK